MYREAAPIESESPRGGRIVAIDLARGVALAAMAIYHFTWDLELFGYVEAGLTAVGGWKLFARCIASSFLFLAGVSLLLAHGDGIRWNGFGRRFAMVAGAAAVISVATYFTVPEAFIFFGILHEIAAASLLGLLFLRLPAIVTFAVAACVVAAPLYLRADIFNHPSLWWVGLSTIVPRSNDFVPIFPWFGAVLAGIASAKLAKGWGLFDRLRRLGIGRWSVPLGFAGRHSLAVYLVHQPVLIGLVWLAAQVAPVSPATREAQFVSGCERQCVDLKDASFCTAYCACVLDTLAKDGVLDEVFAASQSQAITDKMLETAAICTVGTEASILEEAPQ